ncbi:hypothetical protein [Streptomyces marispadix]|uniref:Uncharacterized protein n=1 Tax=Streptomyces marispadix TaxID=2922868 RepID=A0ABS9SUP6_9ACTN|nr:hypothetical protein [Streptomyces marispadix]MCH6160006.1 hypothetical protein [Streptomyces marispadix]
MRRFLTVALAVCAPALLMPASSAGASGRTGTYAPSETSGTGGGLHGPVVTHPQQKPVDYPAGEVCPFAAHAEFPVADLTLRTWYDDERNPVFGVESGPLVMRVTNLDTGRTVTRDLSGTGTLTYPGGDPDSHILGGGDWGVGLHTSDRPVHNKWLISHGHMSVQITTEDGTTKRRLLSLIGPYENLCETLGE